MTSLKDVGSGWTEFPDEALKQAESLAQKAIELDDGNAEAHALLGRVYTIRGQLDVAISEEERAIALNPNDAGSYATRGAVLVYSGHPKEAIESFKIAMRLNPGMGSSRYEPVGWAYYLERRYEEAVTALKAGVRTSPSDYYNYAGLAASYAQLGRTDEAVHAAEEVRRIWPFFEVDSFVAQFDEANRALIVEGLHKVALGLKVTYVATTPTPTTQQKCLNKSSPAASSSFSAKAESAKPQLAPRIAKLAAASGSRALLMETGTRAPLAAIFGVEPSFDQKEVAPNLSLMTLEGRYRPRRISTPRSAKPDAAESGLREPSLPVLRPSRARTPRTDDARQDLLRSRAQRFQGAESPCLIIVDAPASGRRP